MGSSWSLQGGGVANIPVPVPPPDPPPPSQVVEEMDNDRRRREVELEKLKEDLSRKRELRRAKLGQVGEELRVLREQLETERLRRMELEVMLKDSGQELVGSKDPGRPSQGECDSKDHRSDQEEVDLNRELIVPAKTNQDQQGSPNAEARDVTCAAGANQDQHGGLEEAAGNGQECEPAEWGEQKKMLEESLAGQQERGDRLEQQVKALKDVANIGKELLTIRELQVEELNKKLKMIEETGVEYEREVESMRRLRGLYEERARATLAEHRVQLERERARLDVANTRLRLSEQANRDLTEQKEEISTKAKQLDTQLDAVKARLSETKVELASKSEQLYHATSHLALINNLFSQVISGPEVDLDRLAVFLEENHSLINQITAKGDVKSVASLAQLAGIEMSPPEGSKEVAQNLTKVWRVLTELLSHHKRGSPVPTEWESCYKSVDTPKGPKVVISVSQTFIKLKDLILEKNSLVKEVGRLKKLNEHLEVRMEEQEKRLTLVTEELCSTWEVVNKLKTQHDNLHTNEKILRYELQHKRNMLNDLKKQLEICRQQWNRAREKNSHAERDWKKLRAEFALRKRAQFSSVESGYEDEETQSPEEDTDEDKSAEVLESPQILSDQEEESRTVPSHESTTPTEPDSSPEVCGSRASKHEGPSTDNLKQDSSTGDCTLTNAHEGSLDDILKPGSSPDVSMIENAHKENSTDDHLKSDSADVCLLQESAQDRSTDDNLKSDSAHDVCLLHESAQDRSTDDNLKSNSADVRLLHESAQDHSTEDNPKSDSAHDVCLLHESTQDHSTDNLESDSAHDCLLHESAQDRCTDDNLKSGSAHDCLLYESAQDHSTDDNLKSDSAHECLLHESTQDHSTDDNLKSDSAHDVCLLHESTQDHSTDDNLKSDSAHDVCLLHESTQDHSTDNNLNSGTPHNVCPLHGDAYESSKDDNSTPDYNSGTESDFGRTNSIPNMDPITTIVSNTPTDSPKLEVLPEETTEYSLVQDPICDNADGLPSRDSSESTRGQRTDDQPPDAPQECCQDQATDFLKRREERLKRMEESCKSLFARMGQTSSRSDEISTKLDQIHAQYGPERQPSDSQEPGSSENTSETTSQHPKNDSTD